MEPIAPPPRARRGRRLPGGGALAVTALLLAFCLLSWPQPAEACVGTPPPPFCGKTLVISQAPPQVILLPAGGTFDVPMLVFFNLVDWPPGTGICPGGPYTVDVAVTTSCTPGPDGAGGLTSEPITPGFTNILVPVTVPAGPPRKCTVTATATVTLADGMVLTATSKSNVCFASEAPGNPAIPRLDMKLLGAPGDEIQRVHPGDQGGFTYEITNNDPAEAFSGELKIEMESTSRMPGVSGPMPPGTGPFSVADPGLGDNPPIAMNGDLVNGCIQLSPDTLFQAPSIAGQGVNLAPGQTRRFKFFARPWGMCPTGTCGRALVDVAGDFSDMSPGLACAGAVIAADASQPPQYQWPGSGQTAEVQTPADPTLPSLELEGQPTSEGPSRGVGVDIAFFGVIEFPLLGPPQSRCSGPGVNHFSAPFELPERGRIQTQCLDTFQVDSFFDVIFDITIDSSTPMLETEVLRMDLTGGPTGLDNVSPAVEGLVRIQDETTFIVDSFFDITYQIQAIGINATTGDRQPLSFLGSFVQPRPDGSGFFIVLEAGQVPPTLGALDAIEFEQDFHGFLSSVPPTEDLIFADGFESGDVSAWSGSVP